MNATSCPPWRISRLRAAWLALLGTSCCFAQIGGTGAPAINESLVTQTLYVSPSGYDDSRGDGSSDFPYGTIQKGLTRAGQLNAQNIGVKVIVQPGIYREGDIGATTALTVPAFTTSKPIILEGAGWSAGVNTGAVIVTGSEPWTGWTSAAGGTWTKTWSYNWGLSPDNGAPSVPEVYRRYEMVHVNGATYYQVTGSSDPMRANLRTGEGCFWVDEANNRITVAPPTGFGDLNAATVEVTVRRRLLHHWRAQTETSTTPFAVRNLVFQHAAPGYNNAAVQLQNMIGLHVEDCVFKNSKNIGLTGGGINSVATWRRLRFSGNAEMGATWRGVNLLAEDCDLTANARQADVSQYYGWGYGGLKLGYTSNATLRRLRAMDNVGLGLWLDTGNLNILVEDSVATGNTTTGLFIENNNRNTITNLGTAGTVLARNCILTSNRQVSSQNSVVGRGLYITESENVTIDDCVIYDNERQVRVANGLGRGPIANVTLKNNHIANRDGTQTLFSAEASTAWTQFYGTLGTGTGGNIYYDPSGATRFLAANASTTLDLAGWRTLTGREGSSSWAVWPAASQALEAESGMPILSPMVVTRNDATAFGGAWIGVPNGTGNQSAAMPATGTATYAFEVYRTGNYAVWARSAVTDATNVYADDSIWLSVDGATPSTWTLNQNNTPSTTWKWGKAPGATPVTYALRPGFHTLKIGWREDGAKLDRFDITADSAYVPGEP